MKTRLTSKVLSEKRERLGGFDTWFPFPALISFGLAMILMIHISSTLNVRLGQPAVLYEFEGRANDNVAIWFSLTESEDESEIIATTLDREVFRWDRNVSDIEDIRPLIDSLKERAHGELVATALDRNVYDWQVNAAIAIDQRLVYSDVKPVLYALAEAGISDYRFETAFTQSDETDMALAEPDQGRTQQQESTEEPH